MEKFTIGIGSALLFLALGVVTPLVMGNTKQVETRNHDIYLKTMGMQTITLGAGCFWCVEAVFDAIEGVESVTSGYMGGHVKNPAYREVCNGTTGHAEVIQVVFNPDIVSLSLLLEVFFATHDPTTLNRQGADAGTQYRSAIFHHSEGQLPIVQQAVQEATSHLSSAIVTTIEVASSFYEAEDYHQSYFELHGEAPYCQAVIAPKMKKFTEKYSFLLKN
ncbi:MAG: peptide-methionine (S)-S-oxide reductase MsrA [Flavobacteriales bacterium]|nr:peptide-methionine (S)-S-oxide reductase MsrA [Flavobacteriales bacterium]